MNWKQTAKRSCQAVLTASLICAHLRAGTPADDDPGMLDGYQKMKESEITYEIRMQQQPAQQQSGKQGYTIIDTIDTIARPFYSNDEIGQITDSAAGFALDKLGGPMLGTVPVSDIAEGVGQYKAGNYDGTVQTFFKAVISTTAGYGVTLLFAPTAPAWAPVVAAGGVAYAMKKILNYVLNLPEVAKKEKGITIGAVAGKPDTDNAPESPESPVTEGTDDPDFGLGAPISMEELASQEAAAGNSSSAGGGGNGSTTRSLLDSFSDKKGQTSREKVQTSTALGEGSIEVAGASRAGDITLEGAKNTISKGGAAAGDIADGSATEIASADAKDSLAGRMADELEKGITEGLTTTARVAGEGAAKKAGSKVFKDKKTKTKSSGDKSAESGGDSDGETVSGGTSSDSSSGGGSSGGNRTGGKTRTGKTDSTKTSGGSSSVSSSGTSSKGTTNSASAGTNTTVKAGATNTTVGTAGTSTTTSSSSSSSGSVGFVCEYCGGTSYHTTASREPLADGTWVDTIIYWCDSCRRSVTQQFK